MKIWFDVQDLFEYAATGMRPSGIQRACYEIYSAARELDGELGFLRHDPLAGTMRSVSWAEIAALFDEMALARPAASALPVSASVPLLHTGVARLPILGPLIRNIAARLPSEIRRPLGKALRAQIAALREALRTVQAIPLLMSQNRRQRQGAMQRPASANASASSLPLAEIVKPGDALVALGSYSWSPSYPALIDRLKRQHGLKFAILMHDMIPLRRPEYFESGSVMQFASYARGCLPLADVVLTVSEATRRDVVSWCEQQGIALAAKPRRISIGTGFSLAQAPATLPAGLQPGSYALFVSTIEARKNHALVFRAWRRLLEEMHPSQVPTLVFAGRIGWMVSDLIQQIVNSRYLGSKLVVIENPDDAVLAALYRGARFTLFPSLFEGWGLPVSESLAFGKVCLASAATSVPEAGGAFCLYHDPDSVTDAVRLYRDAINTPHIISDMERKIAEAYRPVSWTSTARDVLQALQGA